jgi:hypothetical protein
MTSAHAEIPQNKQGHSGSTPVEALAAAVNENFAATLASLEDLVAIPDCVGKL